MTDFSRRQVLRTGAALGAAGLLSQGVGTAAASSEVDLEKFVQPLPVPAVREPDEKRRGVDYHEVDVVEFEQQVHPDLPPTTMWGYDGQFPGPVIEGRRNKPLEVEFDNSDLPTDHLLGVDEHIGGTKPEDYPDFDGEVPEVRTVTHFHGLNVAPESDGQADMWDSPEGVTGPRHSRDVHRFPNRQPRLSAVYHDHARGISRLNNYAGLVGPYYITDPRANRHKLPEGDYDIPLVLTDRSFHEDGSLKYPSTFKPNVAGDVALVNGAAWPYLEVEPRRYRFRVLNPSNGRTYALKLEHEDGHHAPAMYQVAAGHGFLEDVVEIGHDGDMESLTVAPFERGEVVVDFSDHAGETFTVTNHAAFPFGGGGGGHGDGGDGGHGDDSGGDHGGDAGGAGLPEIMQIRVTDPDRPPKDKTRHPSDLNLRSRGLPDEGDATNTRQVDLTMKMGEDPPLHLVNDKGTTEPVEMKPTVDSTEVWELTNHTMHTHPIHLHLVQYRVIGRGPDGTEPPLPNERGGKDTVRVNPGETVRIAVTFENYTGQYPVHCHILEHEDHEMMRPFEVVAADGDDERDDRGTGRDDDGEEDDDNGDGTGRGRGNGNGRGNGTGH